MIITDAHTHIFPDRLASKASESISNFYNVENRYKEATVNVLEDAEHEAGISKTLICSSAVAASQVRSINDFIAKTCSENKQFIGLGTLHPDFPGIEAELDRVVGLGLHGLKFHSDFQKIDIDDERMIRIYKGAAERGLIVLLHMGDNRTDHTSPERLANIIKLVPELKVIAAHFGGYLCWDKIKCIPKSENVYFDTSSSLSFIDAAMARDLIRYFGADKFLFGSDFPMWNPKEELEKFLALNLDENENEMILHKNFEKLFAIYDPCNG